jgi:hypothetical protein
MEMQKVRARKMLEVEVSSEFRHDALSRSAVDVFPLVPFLGSGASLRNRHVSNCDSLAYERERLRVGEGSVPRIRNLPELTVADRLFLFVEERFV